MKNFDYDHQDTRKCKSMDLGKKLQKKPNYFLRFGEVIILSLKWLNVIFFVQSV